MWELPNDLASGIDDQQSVVGTVGDQYWAGKYGGIRARRQVRARQRMEGGWPERAGRFRRCGMGSVWGGPKGSRGDESGDDGESGSRCAASPPYEPSTGRCTLAPRPFRRAARIEGRAAVGHVPASSLPRRPGKSGKPRSRRGHACQRSLIVSSAPVHRSFIERCSTCSMSEGKAVRQRIALRDALTARVRTLTSCVLAVSAVLSGLFAGIAAASAPGHRLPSKASALRPQRSLAASGGTSTVIPPLPAPPGAGNQSAAPPSASAPAPAPSATQSPPVVVTGGS